MRCGSTQPTASPFGRCHFQEICAVRGEAFEHIVSLNCAHLPEALADARGAQGVAAYDRGMRKKTPLTVLAAAAMLALAGCSGTPASAPETTEPAAAATQTTEPLAAGACVYTPSGNAAKEVQAPAAEPSATGAVPATISTSLGDLVVNLDADAAPCTVNNFTSLAAQGYFDDTQCHRLTTQGLFVLQCGDPSATGRGGPGYSFADELNGTETYPAGTLATANAGPNTNGSQFFIVYADTQLRPDYTVFGQLDEASTQLVADVAANGTATGAPDGPPKDPITINGVSVD